MSNQPEYIYGRVVLSKWMVEKFLKRMGGELGRLKEDGSAEFTFFKYAHTAEEARDLPQMLRAFASELNELAYDLDHFIDNHPVLERRVEQG
jgi:hypothetical protein